MTRPRLVALLLVAGAVAYSLWILAPLLGSRLDPGTAYVSELYALGQPYSWLFRIGDATSGVCLIAAMLIYRPPVGRWWQILRLAVGMLGFATICDSSMPLFCTPTADASCKALERANALPWYHVGHSVSSGVAAISLTIAVIALAMATRHLWGWVIAGVLLVVIAWVVWEAGQAEYDIPAPGFLGWAQRTQVMLTILWLATLPAWLRHRDPA